MIVTNRTRENFTLKYPLERIAPLESVLFFDIETTGFLAKSSHLYLIGCAYYQDNNWNITKWLAEDTSQESLILKEFVSFTEKYTTLIHFNGAQFDIPYIKQKCEQFGLPHSLDEMQSVDIYKGIAPYKTVLNLPNCKQKTLEQYLGIHRDDQYNGGELIEIYKCFCKCPTKEHEDLLLLHNYEDVCGMLDCLPILSFAHLFSGDFAVNYAEADKYNTLSGETGYEFIIYLKANFSIPIPLMITKSDMFARISDTGCQIKIPIYCGELKYFYPNYKDYYYLPVEDKALHKSVAGYMDKAFRQQAKAHNCYTRKEGHFLPQWDLLFEPVFKHDYKDSQLYFECNEKISNDQKMLYDYAKHILNKMAM